jgi:transcriptional antiterminator NusG
MSNELTTNLASSKANTSIARWYAVQVASSCEKKVKPLLVTRSHERAVPQSYAGRVTAERL